TPNRLYVCVLRSCGSSACAILVEMVSLIVLFSHDPTRALFALPSSHSGGAAVGGGRGAGGARGGARGWGAGGRVGAGARRWAPASWEERCWWCRGWCC